MDNEGKLSNCFSINELLRLFSNDAFFLRTFTYVRSIRVNERVYVFWALRTYTYVFTYVFFHHWKTALKGHSTQNESGV